MTDRELKRGDPAMWLELGDRAFWALCWWAWKDRRIRWSLRMKRSSTKTDGREP